MSQKREIIIESCKEKIRSCNVCNASTYDSRIGPKVENLNTLKIAGFEIILCDRCLQDLRIKINNYTFNTEEN